MVHAVLLLSALQGQVGQAEFDESHNLRPADATPPQSGPRGGALPIAASVVPGFLLHGSGHYAAGEKITAWSLLKWETLGLAGMASGTAGLVFTGAARQTVGVLVLLTMAGTALFFTTWLADIYGATAPCGGWGSPLRVEPWLQTRFGTRYVQDRIMAGKLFLGPAFDLRLQRWRWSPGAWLALGSHNMRFENVVAYRAYGPLPSPAAAALDGSFIDLVTGIFHHRYREDVAGSFESRFQLTSIDARVEARLDLQRIAPSLTGSFVEGNAGMGVGGYRFPNAAAMETNTVLLGGFGFGAYLGRRTDRWGQVRAYYNHRHDEFAGGLKTSGLGSGAFGHFGADALAYFSQHWGLHADIQGGSAWIATLSALYRYGRVSL